MLYHQTHNSATNYAYNSYIYKKMNYKAHFHRNFEVIYVFEGKISCTVNEVNRIMNPGDFAMILPNEIHAVEMVGEGTSWIGVYSGDFIHAFEKKVRGNVGSDFVFRCESSVEEFLKLHLIKKEQPPIYLIKACLYALCNEYEKAIELSPRKDKKGILMIAITDYIAENYRNKISLSEMAEKVGYNYHYLSKCFHRIFAMSFSEFINMYRLDAALVMLTETDKDIIDIALESGFQSVRSFNDYFVSHVGTTPSKYRRTQR